MISQICNNEYLQRLCLITWLTYAIHDHSKHTHSKRNIQNSVDRNQLVHDNSSKTISPIRQSVANDFWTMRHFAEYDIWSKKNSQVRHSVEIVKSLFFDQTSYSTERRIYQMSLIIKKNHKKSLCLPDLGPSMFVGSETRRTTYNGHSYNFIKQLQNYM